MERKRFSFFSGFTLFAVFVCWFADFREIDGLFGRGYDFASEVFELSGFFHGGDGWQFGEFFCVSAHDGLRLYFGFFRFSEGVSTGFGFQFDEMVVDLLTRVVSGEGVDFGEASEMRVYVLISNFHGLLTFFLFLFRSEFVFLSCHHS